MWGGTAVLGGVRNATAELQLRDSLNTDIQVFQLLSDDALRRTPTQVHLQMSRTAVLWGNLVRPNGLFLYRSPAVQPALPLAGWLNGRRGFLKVVPIAGGLFLCSWK